jgi:hypothetical protein
MTVKAQPSILKRDAHIKHENVVNTIGEFSITITTVHPCITRQGNNKSLRSRETLYLPLSLLKCVNRIQANRFLGPAHLFFN